MKNLIKFELRKILTKRFAVISVAAVLLLSLILSFSTLHSMYAFDGNGAEETGKAAVEIDKQIALKYEGKSCGSATTKSFFPQRFKVSTIAKP